MKNINWSTVPEQENRRIAPGGYVCRIMQVEDVEDREYLRINYDIYEGPLTEYFSDTFDRFGSWPNSGVMYRSYKDSCLGMFKEFISALEKSNTGFTWGESTNRNPSSIRGLLIGVILREEEYQYNGETKTRLCACRVCPVDDIRAGRYRVPEKKRLVTGDDW